MSDPTAEEMLAHPPPAPLAAITEMGRSIGRRWAAAHRDERAFPLIAAEALAAAGLQGLDLEEMVQWVASTPRIPRQRDVDSSFGEPSFTAFVGDGFYVELLFWLDGTTRIHRHAFSGAFQVLLGSSLHSRFEFRPERRINSRLHLGQLELAEAELLHSGDVRPIVAGDGLIHSAFHLERPSLTLVVRTDPEDDARPQFDYLRPGVAIDLANPPALFKKRLQLVTMLKRLGHPGYPAAVLRALQSCDLEGAARSVFHPELVSAPGVRDHLAARDDVGDARRWLVPACEEAQRMYSLLLWRRAVTDDQLRFFLGLLLTVPAPGPLLGLLRQRYSGDPVARVAALVRRMSELQQAVPEAPPVIDVPVDETTLALVGRLLTEARPGALDRPRSRETVRAAPGDGRSGPASWPGQPGVESVTAERLRRSAFLRALLG